MLITFGFILSGQFMKRYSRHGRSRLTGQAVSFFLCTGNNSAVCQVTRTTMVPDFSDILELFFIHLSQNIFLFHIFIMLSGFFFL